MNQAAYPLQKYSKYDKKLNNWNKNEGIPIEKRVFTTNFDYSSWTLIRLSRRVIVRN